MFVMGVEKGTGSGPKLTLSSGRRPLQETDWHGLENKQ